MTSLNLARWSNIRQVIGIIQDSIHKIYDTKIHIAWSTETCIHIQIK